MDGLSLTGSVVLVMTNGVNVATNTAAYNVNLDLPLHHLSAWSAYWLVAGVVLGIAHTQFIRFWNLMKSHIGKRR